MSSTVRVLIVDDSPLVRTILKNGLEQFKDITIIGAASDPYEARDIIEKTRPDVITLDIEMPKMNGIEFLRHLMKQLPTPVIMVSSLSEKGQQITFDALSFGACDFVTKPQANDRNALTSMITSLYQKIKTASTVLPSQLKKNIIHSAPYSLSQRASRIAFKKNCIISIGASTGGTEAIKEIIPKLPPNFPPIVLTQHMPKGFTALFAKRLDSQSSMSVVEAVHGTSLETGTVYIAPGGAQMRVKASVKGTPEIEITDDEPMNGHKPSVGYLFESLLDHHNFSITAALLTGMGRDGAEALLKLKKSGAYTIAQDQESSVVFGMPGEAVRIGGTSAILPLSTIAEELIQQTKEQ